VRCIQAEERGVVAYRCWKSRAERSCIILPLYLSHRAVPRCRRGAARAVPFITATDLLGAGVDTTDFVVGGTCSEQLYGVCEAMYKPNLEAEDLFEVISQALLAGVDRDCLSGWGAIVRIITPDGVIQRELKSRKD
jgi:hypothetical protein